jgi:predicted negative regulator of RcsB-dependent stress response
MALQLDLEEQEQIDQLKQFWARFGDYVVWALIVVLSAYAAWNGWQYWQRKQAAQSAVLFETVERASAGSDTALMERAFSDIKAKFGSTTYANQAALIVSKALYDKGESQKAEDALNWVIKNPVEAGYESLARLRLSSLLIERGAFAEAKAALGEHTPAEFLALVEDRLGDIDLLEKHPDTATTHYLKSYTALQANAPYRKFVEAKLNTLGVDPVAQSLSVKLSDSTSAAEKH